MAVRAPELALWLLRPSRGGRELETRLTDDGRSVWLAPAGFESQNSLLGCLVCLTAASSANFAAVLRQSGAKPVLDPA